MRSGLLLLGEKPKAVIVDTRFWPNPVVQAAKANGELPLRSCHRRNPERPVNRSHDIEVRVGNHVDHFTHQPNEYLRKQLCFK